MKRSTILLSGVTVAVVPLESGHLRYRVTGCGCGPQRLIGHGSMEQAAVCAAILAERALRVVEAS